jgi:predicted ATPase
LCADNRQRTWFVDLAPLSDSTLVLPTLAKTIGAANDSGTGIDAITSFIGSAPMLIIFDNCEHLVEECGRVAGALLNACGNIRILATSREPLQIAGESTYRLPSLAVPPNDDRIDPEALTTFSAIELFLERATACNNAFRRDSDELEHVAQITRRLDGIPLAIELAAAQTRTLATKDLRAKLHNTFKILTTTHRGSLPRQTTLRALIDWSYDLLKDRERTLFKRLAIFPGSWPLEAVHAVCADEALAEDEPERTLLSLVDKSLIAVTLEDRTTRYRLLQATRSYALEKLSDAERDVLARRHADWVADFAETAFDASWIWSEEEWQNVVSPELDNIRSALSAMLGANGDALVAARISANVARLWYEGGL